MKLYAYYRQDHNGFSLFFNDNGKIQRACVENIHGLRDLLNDPGLKRVDQDDKQHVQQLLSMELESVI
jgi:hypothetical protein